MTTSPKSVSTSVQNSAQAPANNYRLINTSGHGFNGAATDVIFVRR